MKAGIAIAGAAGFATILDPREVLAQGRVFPPPPPAVSPIAGLMDTHVHTAPDVFGRALDDVELAKKEFDYEGEWCPACEFWHGRDRFTGRTVN